MLPARAAGLLLLLLPAGSPPAAAADTPVLEVRLHAVRVSDDDGNRAADITPAEVARWIDRANGVYAVAAVRFLFDGESDFSDLRSTVINGMTGTGDANWEEAVALANAEAHRHPGRMVVYFRHGPGMDPTGGGFSSTDYDFVVMPGFRHTSVCGHQNITILAHEVGHFMGLNHTFASSHATVAEAEEFLESRGGDPAVFDGDRLPDTPPDPCIAEVQGGETATVTLGGRVLPLPRDNIMSYLDSGVKTLSPYQVKVLRTVVGERARHGGALPVNAGAARTAEAESMEVLERRRCAAAPQKMDAWFAGRWSGGAQLWSGGGPGATVTLALPVAEAGEFRFDLYATRAPDFGIVQVLLDGEPVGASVDLFGTSVRPTGAIPLGRVRLRKGRARLEFRVVGKGDLAYGQGFGIDAVDLVREIEGK